MVVKLKVLPKHTQQELLNKLALDIHIVCTYGAFISTHFIRH